MCVAFGYLFDLVRLPLEIPAWSGDGPEWWAAPFPLGATMPQGDELLRNPLFSRLHFVEQA